MKFTIPGRLDGLNEYTSSNRTNRYKANNEKKLNQMHVKYAIRIDFMEECYNAGFRPLRDKWDSYSKSRNDEIHKLILRIIKIVVEY